MTAQQTYEQIREFFSRPDAVLAYRDDAVGNGCMYRGDSVPSSSLRCAFGCVIPDHLYDPLFEGNSAFALLDSAGEGDQEVFEAATRLRDYFAGVDPAFLEEAQAAHDNTAMSGGSVASFLVLLNDVADSFGLTVAGRA